MGFRGAVGHACEADGAFRRAGDAGSAGKCKKTPGIERRGARAEEIEGGGEDKEERGEGGARASETCTREIREGAEGVRRCSEVQDLLHQVGLSSQYFPEVHNRLGYLQVAHG